MSKRIRGENVQVRIGTDVVPASTGCSIQLKVNTADASSKSDKGGGLWDNQEYVNYDWSLSNDSFILNMALIKRILSEDLLQGKTEAGFDVGDGENALKFKGDGIISQLQLTASVGEYAKLSLSVDGQGVLQTATPEAAVPKYEKPVKGKALMVAMKGADGNFHTLAAAKSHTLTISSQSSEVMTKDDNDMAVWKEVTGMSLTVSTENLVQIKTSEEAVKVKGMMASDLMETLMGGKEVELQFGYYADSVGKEAGEDEDWAQTSDMLVSGKFLCTSLTINGNVKENATYSAEFVCKGEPKVK